MSQFMIEEPAFIHIDLANGTRITGRAKRYSDPLRADTYSAFAAEFEDGGTHYTLWAAIVRVSVFPLTAALAPEPTPLVEIPVGD